MLLVENSGVCQWPQTGTLVQACACSSTLRRRARRSRVKYGYDSNQYRESSARVLVAAGQAHLTIAAAMAGSNRVVGQELRIAQAPWLKD